MSTQTTIAPELTGTWGADPVHSNVSFAVTYMGISKFTSVFKSPEAKLSANEGSYSLSGAVRAENIEVADANLRGHLLSDEFFGAESHPEITFTSEDLSLEEGNVQGKGVLSIRGNESEIEITGTLTGPIEDAYGNQRIGLNIKTVIDRTKHGLNWNMPLPTGKPALANDVEVSVELQLVKA